MSSARLFIKAVTPIASILLILAGILQLRAQSWTVGGICVVLAMLGFILSIRLLEKTPPTTDELIALRPWMLPVISWAVVVGLLTLSVFYVADHFESAQTDRIAAIAWLGSVILGLFIVWGKPSWAEHDRSLMERIRANRTEVILLLVVLLLAFAVRTIDLINHPYPWSGDEASIGSEANRILNGEVTNFFETGWSSQPNWSFFPTAITELIVGKNILAVRIPSALAGTLAVLFVYLAARELFNPTIALMAGVFLATLPYHVHFSRIGVHNVVESVMSALIFWLIARAMKTDDPRYYYSAGAVGGLCIYTYAGTRLALILGGLAILFLIIRQRSYLYSHWKHLIAFAAGIVVSAAPQAAFFARHPDIFIGRFGQEGILFNGWLTQQVVQTGKTVWEILLSQFTRTFMVFIASPAPGNFFNSPVPYLTILGSILFLLGMGYALAFGLKPRHFILLIWFWTVILFGGVLTMNPPANTRLLMTAPAVALLMALGAYKVIEYLQRFRILPERFIAPIFILIAGVVSYQNVSFYMGEYKTNNYFHDANGEYAMEIALMAKERGKDFQIFNLSTPRIYSGFPTFAFIAPDNPRADLSAESIPDLQLSPNGEIGFFAIPENRALLQDISHRYPGGESGVMYRRTKPNEVLFEYYIIKP
ncbi:MAG TPA: glycosyltransferase family 39 protein [Anaerolineales bacterium]|nr:glycosyltransferase family 39 protein [Anaerolineales bacterium]